MLLSILVLVTGCEPVANLSPDIVHVVPADPSVAVVREHVAVGVFAESPGGYIGVVFPKSISSFLAYKQCHHLAQLGHLLRIKLLT